MDSESRLRVSKSMKLEVSSWDRKFGSTWETLLNFSQCSFWHFSFLELKLFRTFVKLSIYSLTLITSITLVKLLQILKSEWTRSSHVASNKVSASRHLGEPIQLEKIIKALENSNFHNWIFSQMRNASCLPFGWVKLDRFADTHSFSYLFVFSDENVSLPLNICHFFWSNHPVARHF